MKNIIIKVRNSVDGFNGRLHTTEGRGNNLRGGAKKIILNVERDKDKLGDTEDRGRKSDMSNHSWNKSRERERELG